MTEGTETETETRVGNSKTGLADDLREHFSGDAPVIEKVRGFAKARPWASGMLVGVAGLPLVGTFGRKNR